MVAGWHRSTLAKPLSRSASAAKRAARARPSLRSSRAPWRRRLAPARSACLFTHAAKQNEAGLAEAAKALGLPLVFLEAEVLRQASLRAVDTLAKSDGAVWTSIDCRDRRACRRRAFLRAARGADERRRCKLRDRGQKRACNRRAMTVHFIGAGPGAPDLITLRGRDLIARSPVCLYAGSLVPQALARTLPKGRPHHRYGFDEPR